MENRQAARNNNLSATRLADTEQIDGRQEAACHARQQAQSLIERLHQPTALVRANDRTRAVGTLVAVCRRKRTLELLPGAQGAPSGDATGSDVPK